MNTSSLEAGLAENATAITVFYGLVVLAGLVIDGTVIANSFRHPVAWREKLSRFYWRPWGGPEAVGMFSILATLFLLLFAFRVQVVGWIEGLNVSVESGLII